MLNNLGLFLGVILSLAGAVLLYKGVSNADASETSATLGGAMLLAVGSVLLWNGLRNWWEWRREYQRYRNE
jgi:high-affinity Fe2+/Pb2+ permease